MKFHITNHCKERYLQRFEKPEIYSHLDCCDIKTCEACKNLKKTLMLEIKNHKLEDVMLNRLKTADETNIHHNNFDFMQTMYEKYGYESRFRFLISRDVLFICRDANVVVTCIPTMNSVVKNFALRPKYNTTKKKKV